MYKEKISIIFPEYKVVGFIHVMREGYRITDYFNQTGTQYVAITQAKMFDRQDNLIGECDFLCANKDNILFIKPEGKKDEEI